jgi:type II secretion system protein G
MLNRMRTRLDLSRDDGFTLIELLIVIVILGILAAIVVFAVGSATTDSKLGACKADKKTIETALEAYKAKAGVYPTAAATDLLAATNGGPYLKAWPGGADYSFTVTTLTSSIAVGAGTAGSTAGC